MDTMKLVAANAAKAFNKQRDQVILDNLSRLLGETVTADDVDRLRGRVSVCINQRCESVVLLDGETVMLFYPPRYEDHRLVCQYKVLR